jgi:hypothetical protein
MATAAPHVKLLRQLASAKDDYLSGAFDISWDGAKATLYLVFGRPSHAVFETDQAQIEGEAAIDALLAALPRVFMVSDWRRAMSPHETLSITIDELAGPFVRLAGSYADDPVTDESPEWWSAVDDSPDLPFGLADFPLLPGGRPLWVEASPEEVHLADRLSELPPSILILTGAKLRAAAVVSGGDLIDAVWIDADDHARGETAGMALLGATKGSLAGYALDDPRVAESLTMLWRLPMAVSGVELSWLDPASMLAAFRADGLDRVLVVDAPVRGIALFSRGGLVAVYSETQRSAVASPERLRSLLSQARGRLTVMERKPRPLAADAPTKPVSAHDFFELEATEPATPETAASVETAASGVGDDAASDGVASEIAAQAEPGAEPEAAAAPASTAVGEPVATWGFKTVDPAQPDAQDALDEAAPPPPPPQDDEASADLSEAPPPPPPAPEAAEPAQKAKRSRWGFGRSRKSRDRRAAEEAAAALPDPSAETGDAATFAGWSVRQPNVEPQAVWLRSHDIPATASTPDPATSDAEVASSDAPAPTWSLARDGDDAPVAVEGQEADASHEEASFAAVDDAPASTALPEEASQAPPALHFDSESHIEHAQAVTDDAGHALEFVSLDAALDAAPLSVDEPVSMDERATAGEAVPLDESASLDEPESVDEHASHEEPTAESGPQATSEAWLSPSWLDDVVSGDAPQTATEPQASSESEVDAHAGQGDEPDASPVAGDGETDDAAEWPAAPVFRTPGPWSWPLAEPDEGTSATAGVDADSPHPSDAPDAPNLEPAAVAAPAHEDSSSAVDSSAEPGFFHRDEPVGSQYVDFDEVRSELVQIGIVWLGETNAVQVTALLSNTRSTIDDFVATIDTIRGLHLEGQDPASIQAMAREMHQQAAERLCGA